MFFCDYVRPRCGPRLLYVRLVVMISNNKFKVINDKEIIRLIHYYINYSSL